MPSANLTIPCKIYEDPYKVKSVILPEYGINPAKADVTEQDVVSGKKFYKSDGSLATGSLVLPPDPVTDEGYYGLRAQTHNDHNLSELKKIIGCSFGWNQLINTGMSLDPSASSTIILNEGTSIVKDHKLLCLAHRDVTETQDRLTFYKRENDSNVNIGAFAIFGVGESDSLILLSPTGTGTSTGSTSTGTEGNVWIYRSSYDSTAVISDIQVFDLTLIFGSAIADYLYSLEAAICLNIFKTLFSRIPYPYNAGTLISTHPKSHRMVGFNKFNPHNVKFGENSNYNQDPGTTLTTSGGESYATVSGDNPVEVEITTGWKGVLFTVDDIVPGVLHKFEVYLDADNTDSIRGTIYLTDDNYVVIRKISNVWYGTGLISYSFTPTASETKFVYAVASSTANNTIILIDPCVHIATNSALDGKYDAYSVADYAFYDTDLNGVPKLIDNSIVYDGDEYTPDGAIVRKYGIVDLGTIGWSLNSSLNGSPAFIYTFNQAKIPSGNGVIANILTPIYETKTANALYVESSTSGIICLNTSKALQVRDFNYSTVADFKAAMSGVYLVYELQYPILESRSAYSEKQALFQNGTEEFVDDRAIPIPVWHETEYIQYVEYINPDPVEEMPSNDVNFIDYDGKIIKSYSRNDFLNLYALPPNPVHNGLISQGWNWTLSDAKEYVRMAGYLDIGQNYDTDDYSIRLYINIYEESNRTIKLMYRLAGSGGYGSVDWGDGTSYSPTGTSVSTEHTYSSIGNYIIKIHVPEGRHAYGYGSSRSIIYSAPSRILVTKVEFSSRWRASTSSNYGYETYMFKNLESITIPRQSYGVSYFYFVGYMMSSNNLKALVIPPGAYFKGGYCLDACYQLSRVSVPKSVVDNVFGGTYCFRNCYALKRIAIPSGATSVVSNCFNGCSSLSKIVIPDSVTSIAASSFANCSALKEIHFKGATPPSVANSNAWTSLPTDCKIYVPSGKLSAYTGATNYPSSSTYTYIEE